MILLIWAGILMTINTSMTIYHDDNKQFSTIMVKHFHGSKQTHEEVYMDKALGNRSPKANRYTRLF